MAYTFRDTNNYDLPSTDLSSLHVRDSHGNFRPATAEDIIEAARRAIARKYRRGSAFTAPSDVGAFLRTKLGALEHEVFAVMLLDTRHRLIEYTELFRARSMGPRCIPGKS